MDRQELVRLASEFTENSEHNYIAADAALTENLSSMKIFSNPVFAFGDAGDELFQGLKAPSAIGEHFMTPSEWLPEARTVISFFMPFTERVKESNAADMEYPSPEWLHGRIEAQAFIRELCTYLSAHLSNAGIKNRVPALDSRFMFISENTGCPDPETAFTSNWSERHAAFICGLGTFGLSKGIITRKGMAGRLGSIITTGFFERDRREYTELYEYCTMCGACVKNCPAKAISMEEGKLHVPCSRFLDIIKEKFRPRYGCGKCQVKVPCESSIPQSRKR